MESWSWLVVILILVAIGFLALAIEIMYLNRKLAMAKLETRQLREMVKKRVERPNIFSHEVRTSLTLIKGAAELLAEETPGELNERQREFVRTISINAEQVIRLAEDLLVEAKIEAKLFELRLQRAELKLLVRKTIRDARRIHSVPIKFEEHSGSVYLMLDPDLISQALMNLINNACRHAGESAQVTVSISSFDTEVVIAVSDGGDGISDEQRAKLFEPFSGGDSDRGGTGLGMMISKQIITEHGGKILVDSVLGKGSTFFVTLPNDVVGNDNE